MHADVAAGIGKVGLYGTEPAYDHLFMADAEAPDSAVAHARMAANAEPTAREQQLFAPRVEAATDNPRDFDYLFADEAAFRAGTAASEQPEQQEKRWVVTEKTRAAAVERLKQATRIDAGRGYPRTNRRHEYGAPG